MNDINENKSFFDKYINISYIENYLNKSISCLKPSLLLAGAFSSIMFVHKFRVHSNLYLSKLNLLLSFIYFINSKGNSIDLLLQVV